jgi:putative component of membrane protein insertase Oxa1/YidC/SpoIIIJ protein YidD
MNGEAPKAMSKINHGFHLFPINCDHIRNRMFIMALWIGTGVVLSGCGVHPPAQTAAGGGAISQIIHFYQGPLDHLSAVRYGGCPMAPHCSAYALMALEKHGPLMGLMMTFDRLIRCGNDEIHLSPEVWVDGRRLTYDPVEANEWNSGAGVKETQSWKVFIEN